MTTNCNPVHIATVESSQVVLIVLMEDELTDTDEHPVCGDPTCPCAQDVAEGED